MRVPSRSRPEKTKNNFQQVRQYIPNLDKFSDDEEIFYTRSSKSNCCFFDYFKNFKSFLNLSLECFWMPIFPNPYSNNGEFTLLYRMIS